MEVKGESASQMFPRPVATGRGGGRTGSFLSLAAELGPDLLAPMCQV